MRVLVTGGAGFVGSALVRRALTDSGADSLAGSQIGPVAAVLTVDKLTYAGHRETLADVAGDPRHRLAVHDIADAAAMARVFAEFRPDRVFHLAAESHVDRSIDAPAAFVATNVVGTHVLLEAARTHWQGLDGPARARFRFLHVSTDEVYGSLPAAAPPVGEGAAYDPSSPYAASKAAADHLARAWARTYGLPVLVTNCCNNYGPYQLPEKLIPVLALCGAAGRPLPLYGGGGQVRDWLHVDDHADALWQVMARGRVGETYNVGARCERTNRQVADAVCAALDDLLPDSPDRPHSRLIAAVADRPGHDRRYAVDPAKVERETGWRARADFDAALRRTVAWYLDHGDWCRAVMGAEAAPDTRRGLGSFAAPAAPAAPETAPDAEG